MSNGNGHDPREDEDIPPVSLWPAAEQTIAKVTDPAIQQACLEGLERQREILAETHRLGSELSEATGKLLGELGSLGSRMSRLTDVIEGMAVRVARLDNEGEVTRDSLQAIRDEANGWRTAAESSSQRAVVANEKAADAILEREKLKVVLREERRHSRNDELEVQGEKKKTKTLLTTAIKVAVGAALAWLAHRLGG